MHYVVGSGPSGTACAKALLARGLRVTMLDAALDLEPEQAEHRDRLATSEPRSWPSDSLAALRAGMQAGPRGVPLKRVFGSDFPFREPPQASPIERRGINAVRSFARGGLSRAWGATILPMAAGDIAAWPLSTADLAPHYRQVMEWVPLAAAPDGLDSLFPMYSETPGALRPSRQAQAILAALDAHRDALVGRGIVHGRARLAVHTRSGEGHGGCIHCRFCLYGCPFGSIFSGDQLLPELLRHPRFTYRGQVLVQRVSETAEEVRLDAVDLANGQLLTFSGERVFLACGVLTTTQLLMETLGVNDVPIQTSQSFLLPLLTTAADRDVRDDESHALSQIYILIDDRRISPRLVQLQIYTYSDLISSALDNSFAGPLLRLLPPLKRSVENRLVVMQGLLPSESSDALSMRRHGAVTELTSRLSPETHRTIRAITGVVRDIGRHGGFVPLTPMLRVSTPGQSFHTGSSFPMSRMPGARQSDLLGRPHGLARVHAVDATVLPDIPAPPLTLTVMANAHRIGTLA